MVGTEDRKQPKEAYLHAEAKVESVLSGKWNVMVIRRDENEFYLGGTMPYFNGPKPFGWLQRIDPVTLETISESPNLPCGSCVVRSHSCPQKRKHYQG